MGASDPTDPRKKKELMIKPEISLSLSTLPHGKET